MSEGPRITVQTVGLVITILMASLGGAMAYGAMAQRVHNIEQDNTRQEQTLEQVLSLKTDMAVLISQLEYIKQGQQQVAGRLDRIERRIPTTEEPDDFRRQPRR